MTLDTRHSLALNKRGTRGPSLVDVPPLRYLQIDGTGDIDGEVFREAESALLGLAYQVKFAAKKRLGLSYKVPPLEAVYGRRGNGSDFDPAGRSASSWRLMNMLPDEIPGEFVEEVRERLAAKRNPPRLADVRVQTFSEGRCVQLLHLGPYAEEAADIERLFDFAEETGYHITGDLHEIYLGDPHRAAAEKLKTVLRYGVRKAAG